MENIEEIITFHYSTCLSSILGIFFHISTYFSSVFFHIISLFNMEENREKIEKIQKKIVKRYGKHRRKVS
jgi:hypothetical protein